MFDHTKQKVYFRGEYMPFSEANISIANTSFLYGLGIFTGMRAHWNENDEQLYLFRPAPHHKRFLNSAKVVKFKNVVEKYDLDTFTDTLVELLRVNNVKQDAYIRVQGYIDEVAIGPRFGEYKDDFYAYIYPLGNYVPLDGMKAKVSSWRRIQDNAIPARIKVNGAYVNTALAKSEALHEGYDEAIVLDENGHVVEGSAENIFVVRDGQIFTPPVTDNILEGITRSSVIEIARNLDIPLKESSIDRTELYFADEVFFSGTGAKVSPVVEIDGYKIGDGFPGEISKKIQDTYFKAVKGKDDTYKDWIIPVYK